MSLLHQNAWNIEFLKSISVIVDECYTMAQLQTWPFPLNRGGKEDTEKSQPTEAKGLETPIHSLFSRVASSK